MKRTEAIYLATEGRADAPSLARAAELARALQQPCNLRRALGAPWLQLERIEREASRTAPEPQSPAWFAALLGADARRWSELSELARSLSASWPADVLTLEGAQEIFWVRYSRWSSGTRRRCFEYAASDVENAGWVRNEGAPEVWEEDEEVGPDIASLARVLGLPSPDRGVDAEASWSAALVVT